MMHSENRADLPLRPVARYVNGDIVLAVCDEYAHKRRGCKVTTVVARSI